MNEFLCPKGHTCNDFLIHNGVVVSWTCPICGGWLIIDDLANEKIIIQNSTLTIH